MKFRGHCSHNVGTENLGLLRPSRVEFNPYRRLAIILEAAAAAAIRTTTYTVKPGQNQSIKKNYECLISRRATSVRAVRAHPLVSKAVSFVHGASSHAESTDAFGHANHRSYAVCFSKEGSAGSHEGGRNIIDNNLTINHQGGKERK